MNSVLITYISARSGCRCHHHIVIVHHDQTYCTMSKAHPLNDLYVRHPSNYNDNDGNSLQLRNIHNIIGC